MKFKKQQIDQLHEEVSNSIGGTTSLCHLCHRHIPALRYERDGKIWIAKACSEHGISHHIIESDADFYFSLICSYENPRFNFNGGILIEGSDRCNLECPHCYHLPDNQIQDPRINFLIDNIKSMPIGFDQIHRIILAGAESTLRPDFPELVKAIRDIDSCLDVSVMTNGIRFNDSNFVKKSLDAGLVSANIGLNHPTYINHRTIRAKQISAIENMHKLGAPIGYISYTMYDFSELNDILKEITTESWTPKNFRIRYGSDIGRNPGQERIWVSDIYKATKHWCEIHHKHFKRIEPADNNIYHVMVEIEDKIVRLIQWCDETDIDMEELRSGPWCNFVPDGITNFLHQIIRRDVWKNKKIILLDSPHPRYLFNRNPEKYLLNLYNL